jgi:phosphatidyl-myo-inositol dimannoside synthase
MTRLLVSKVFPPRIGGSGRWFWELYRRLPRSEYVWAVGEHPRQEQFDRTQDARIARLPLALPDLGLGSLSGLIGYARAFGALHRIARSERASQVHAGSCLPEGWLALLLRWTSGLRYLVYVHGEEVKLASTGEPAGMMSSRQLRWMTGAVLHGADLIVANSQHSARILQQEWAFPSERVRVLYPGVDTAHFTPADRSAAVRQQLGWDDRPVLLTVGRLQRRKGHDHLIRAMSLIRRTIPDALYAIVGDGEERAFLERLVVQEDLSRQVQFLGEVDDDLLLRCYQQCDLFVLPNRQIGRDLEGFGLVLLEAQACGKPVLAGASGGTAETMQIPETGLVVPCEDPARLAATVTELLLSPERLARLGRAARSWTVERFDWDLLASQAQQLFEESEATASAAPLVTRLVG